MTILEMIAEWRKGCSNTMDHPGHPERCEECTLALINAIERKALEEPVATEVTLYGVTTPEQAAREAEHFRLARARQ